MADPIVSLLGITKKYNVSKKTHSDNGGVRCVLDNIDLVVYPGEFLTFLGPSGCGKTTLLRIIAGSVTPDQGKVVINGQDVTFLRPQQRQINMVFQNYALFPHMTVYDNIAFGLRCRKVPKEKIREQVLKMLAMIKLEELAYEKPSQLSGGQQQRVAIARAAINQPIVLLLDEPLSALDYNLRKRMQIELKSLQKKLNLTFIMVTHDQEEALSLSDRIVILNQGKIVQLGTPREIYEQPSDLYVAKFIGDTNIFNAVIKTEEEQKLYVAEVEDTKIYLKSEQELELGQRIKVVVRPEDLRVYTNRDLKLDPSLVVLHMIKGIVKEVIYKGSTVDLIVELSSGNTILATEFFNEDDEDLIYNIGEEVQIHWIPGWEVILKDES